MPHILNPESLAPRPMPLCRDFVGDPCPIFLVLLDPSRDREAIQQYSPQFMRKSLFCLDLRRYLYLLPHPMHPFSV
jgi:hypothetical protein